MPIESSETNLKKIPDCQLPDLDGAMINLREHTLGRVSVVFFSCNHCPYVNWIENKVGELSRQFPEITWLAICSNDVVAYPEDDIVGLRSQTQRTGWNFPYLVDSNQVVAHLFGAVCTPDFFVFDVGGKLIYRGAIDQSRPNSQVPIDAQFLYAAIECARVGEIFTGGRPSLGCGIKWIDPEAQLQPQ
jgi:peroxiredoxin